MFTHMSMILIIVISIGTDKIPLLMNKTLPSRCTVDAAIIKLLPLSQIHPFNLFFVMLRLGLYKLHSALLAGSLLGSTSRSH